MMVDGEGCLLYQKSKKGLFYTACNLIAYPQEGVACDFLMHWKKDFKTFTFMHLADAFIQSDLQCIQSIHFIFISMCVAWELNPQPFALLTQCSTTEPQEHLYMLLKQSIYKERSQIHSYIIIKMLYNIYIYMFRYVQTGFQPALILALNLTIFPRLFSLSDLYLLEYI